MIEKENKPKNRLFFFAAYLTILVFVSCSTENFVNPSSTNRQIANSPALIKVANPKEFPEIIKDNGELAVAVKDKLKKLVKRMPEDELLAASERLRRYLMFLGISAQDFKKVEAKIALIEAEDDSRKNAVSSNDPEEEPSESEDGDKTPSNLKAVQRLFISNTQFLDCEDLVNWECLERDPKLRPLAEFRNPLVENLGKPILAGNSLDMDVFFTQAWDGSPRSGVAEQMAERLKNDVGKSLSLAFYGMDDIDGSIKGIYSAIAAHAKTSSVNVRAVVDVFGFEKGESPWVFDYIPPDKNSPEFDKWLFGDSTKIPGKMHVTFQYDGTPNFIQELNSGIKLPEEARARIEWSTSGIMHNKFAVMENHQGAKSVWTGTANISKNCMGTERNSNMSVYIKNDLIAKSFLDQFNLMYNFDSKLPIRSRLVTNSKINPIKYGRFHRNKYPNTNRFFVFRDDTKVRVHFAPTDDAEHRSILPMLLSAQEGDEIRISMFGGTGFEIVRAMQFAAAKGATVRIVFDARLGHGLTSWTRDSILNVFMANPYIGKIPAPQKPGSISVRMSAWEGKNHYKVGTLTRKLSNGSMRAEQIILGSQNWSGGGNDSNDENIISIQNLTKDVKSAKMFNQEFDARLWVKSRPAVQR